LWRELIPETTKNAGNMQDNNEKIRAARSVKKMAKQLESSESQFRKDWSLSLRIPII
jgi:hypothetical protein